MLLVIVLVTVRTRWWSGAELKCKRELYDSCLTVLFSILRSH